MHCPSSAALNVRCHLWQVGRIQVAISHSVPCTSKMKCHWLTAAQEWNWCRKLASMKEPIYTAHHSPATWSLVVMGACLIVYGVCLSAVSDRATSVYLCHYLWLYSLYVLHVLDGVPVSCAGTPESPAERAVSHVVETMSGEVPPQQTEQGESTGGVAQAHLKEERCVGWCIAHAYLPSLVFSNSQM